MSEYIPKIHILYAFPFDNHQRRVFAEKNIEYPSVEAIERETYALQDVWAKFNNDDSVIRKLIDIMCVNPGYDYEFYIYARGRFGAMSVPLMLSLYNREGEKFTNTILVETIVHEIIHRFASSPRKELSFSTRDYWKYVRETYPECIPSTQNHLIVYAVLFKLLPEIFTKGQVQKLELYYSRIISPGYKEAMEMVKEKGSDFFINEFIDRITKY